MQSTIASISGARREVLAGPALGVLGVLLEQPFVGVALDVGIERASSVSLSIRSTISRRELGRVLDLVLRLPEDDARACPARLPSASRMCR